MESRFAFTCCSKWNHGNGGALILIEIERGEQLLFTLKTLKTYHVSRKENTDPHH